MEEFDGLWHLSPNQPGKRRIETNMAEITNLLHAASRGGRDAEELLLEQIYGELHQLALRFLSLELLGAGSSTPGRPACRCRPASAVRR